MDITDRMQAWAMSNGIADLQRVTLSARKRTGIRISTTVKRGLFQVVRVDYAKNGSSKITSLSAWVEKERAISFMESL